MEMRHNAGMDENTLRIAFLRAINVGGHVVKNDQLRSLFESLGMQNVASFLASGNIYFDVPKEKVENLELVIESGLQAELGYRVATFLRTGKELMAVTENQPYPPDIMNGAAAYNIGFLKEEPSEMAKKKLLELQTEIDRLQVHGREVYWVCQVKQSQSTLTNAAFEKALGMECTLRGINSVRRIEALVAKRQVIWSFVSLKQGGKGTRTPG
jgi:uncharacterized protein (DUF1697 family)